MVAVPQPEDEEAVLREKEMRAEASVTTGWVEVLRLKGSARLSGRKRKAQLAPRTNDSGDERQQVLGSTHRWDWLHLGSHCFQDSET